MQAGLEFRFPPGWHGYWRTPGDAGIAPHLDWSRAPDVASASMQWPAPARLVVSGLQNAVYTGDVVLPLTIRLRDAHAPARLMLSLDYATCSNVCVPKHSDLTLVLPQATGTAPTAAQAASLDAARAAIPRAPARAGITIVDVALTTPAAPAGVRRLNVQAHSDTQPFGAPDLFVEGAGDGLPAAPAVRLSNYGRDVRFDVDLPAQGAGTRPLTLTLVDGARRAVRRPA